MTTRFVCLSAVAAVLLSIAAGSAAAQRDSERIERERRARLRARPSDVNLPPGKVEYYVSKMDGERRPYGVCAVGAGEEKVPLVVLVNPGLSTHPNEDGLVRAVREFGARALKHNKSCVLIRPTGRGPGSVFQNYGEVDALEAIEDACQKFAIDADRISVFGHSMGGAATWYLAAHYPDKFASAVPMSGYCDYRLWGKVGGTTYHMFPWEEPSWRARSAAFLVENFEHTPVWILHGARDRALGGGVPVEQAREMNRLLSEQRFSVKYTEIPGAGHHFAGPAFDNNLEQEILLWMLEQKKVRNPRHVEFATFDLRHNRSYWVTVEQLETYGERGSVDARLADDGNVLTVATENVRSITLGPISEAHDVRVRLNGQGLGRVDLTSAKTFQNDETWRNVSADFAGRKRHGQSGPIGDLFFDDCLFVNGTGGTEDDALYLRAVAGYMHRMFNQENGGLHRGGIMGENTVDLQALPDTELSEAQITGNNLLLFGTDRTNALIKRFLPKLPLKFEAGAIRLGDKVYFGDQVALFAVFPHPENPGRYVAIHGGVTPDAVVWGSHLHLLLLPDYIVYNGADALAWGFFDNEWK